MIQFPAKQPSGEMYRKARITEEPPLVVIRGWLTRALTDFRDQPAVSLLYGGGLCLTGWGIIAMLLWAELGWMILPAMAGGMLVGPVVAVGLYRVSAARNGTDLRIAAPGQLVLAGAILMVFALIWLRAATLIFAVFFGLRPFSGPIDTLWVLVSTTEGLATLSVGTVTGGLFAALGFAISVFSIPLLVARDIDCFSAMALSFNATTHNFKLMMCWAVVVTSLFLVGLLTGLLGLIVAFPVLGFASWHAFSDLFKGDRDDRIPATQS